MTSVLVVDDEPRIASFVSRALSAEGFRVDSASDGLQGLDLARTGRYELVVLDSVGRLQLPGDQRALAGIGRRARVELVDGGILIRPGDDDASGAIASSEASDEATGDVLSYSSLYSPEPPAAKNGKVNGKAKWRLWRRAK